MIQINCPSCGSPVQFKSEYSVYSTCGSCDALLVRQDVNLQEIGKVAELQPDGSPLKVGTIGSYQGKDFEVLGRIQVTYQDGFWNEWFLQFNDGKTGWIGEAMGEYFLNFNLNVEGQLPAYQQLQVGQTMAFGGDEYVVTNLMMARVVSFEGELPFIMKQGYDLPFADLRSSSGKAATLDYSEGAPSLFLGEFVPFRDLNFKNLRLEGEETEATSQPASMVKRLNCTGCGAPIEIKGGPRSQVVVCEYCDTAIDATDPNYGIIWRAEQQKQYKVTPALPIGSKGTIDDIEWEVIGFMRRSVTYEGVLYPWSEYLLFNRYNGYRWLVESDGHWTFMSTLYKLPTDQTGRPMSYPNPEKAHYDGKDFRHFQSAEARVDYVAGEFYWKVRLNDRAVNHDYVHPPELISMEVTNEGIHWSHGQYMTGKEVWRAFGLEGRPPGAAGVAPNQPNPHKSSRSFVWSLFWSLSLLAFLFTMGQSLTNDDRPFFSKTYDYMSYEQERSRVTEPFQIKGRTSNVKVRIKTDLSNRWAYWTMSLVDKNTNQARSFGKTVEYYSGDGSRDGSVILPSIPPGTYFLLWEPQSGTGYTAEPNKPPATRPGQATPAAKKLFTYTIELYRDVPQWSFFFWLFFLLMPIPLWVTMRYNGFEGQRWQQSDHAAF